MEIACFYFPEIGIAVELARIPFYRGEPVVLATVDGVIQAVSPEAQKAAVCAGMTITGARALCRSLIVLAYNRSIYEEAAEPIWDLLATESNTVEPVCPEICFVLLSEASSVSRAEMLGQEIAKRMGIPVKIGIGSSKVVARNAATQESNRSVVRVQIGMEAVFLASIPVSTLDQISPLVRQRLQRLGVTTLGDILRLPKNSLTYQFKTLARKLQMLAVGDDGEVIRPLWPPPSIEHEVTFDEDVESLERLKSAIRTCAVTLEEALIVERSYCRKISIQVTLEDGTVVSRSEPQRSATNLASKIGSAAQRLMNRLVIDRPISALKIICSGLGSGSGVQLTLLSENDQTREEERERQRKLEETLVFVRKLFGVRAIVPASLFKTARQIQLMIYPLGLRKRESVMVATNQQGRPVRFYRYQNNMQKRHAIVTVQDEWNQAAWAWDTILETHCYRVVTDPWGLHQLEQLGVEWTLTATAD